MRLVQVTALLAASAAAIDDLSPCQSRCYDMTADLIGCEADDYACHCSAWDGRFSPQMSSCMIEGCAFGDEGPTMGAFALSRPVYFSGLASRVPGPAAFPWHCISWV